MTRRLWRIVKPSSAGDRGARERYAEPDSVAAYAPGVPLPSVELGACANCGAPVPRPARVQPLVLEFGTREPANLGDVTWPAGTYLPVLAEPLAAALAERFSGVQLGPVEVRERRVRTDGRPGAKLPRRLAAQTRDLRELWVIAACAAAQGSTLRVVRPSCPVCGLVLRSWGEHGMALAVMMKGAGGLTILEGVEQWTTGHWDPRTKSVEQFHHPHEEGRGLIVSSAALDDAGMFHLEGESKWLLCTDEVKRFFEARECTNVGFLRGGYVSE